MMELSATVSSIHAVVGSVVVFHADLDTGKRIRMVAHRDFTIQPGEYRCFAGKWESYKQTGIRGGETFRTSKDVLFVELGKGKDVAKEAIEQYLLHHQGGETVQIISATKRVMAQANRRLQAKLLENAPVVPWAPEFQINNKVIYRRNDWLVGLVNGSMGVVVPTDGDQSSLTSKPMKWPRRT